MTEAGTGWAADKTAASSAAVGQALYGDTYLPIEVKLTDRPSARNARHLDVFMREYGATQGLLVCTAPRAVRLARGVTAVPWGELTAAAASRI